MAQQLEKQGSNKVGFKTHQFIKIPYPDNGDPQTASFNVNSLIPVDKIRISIAGDLTSTGFHPGILVYSDMVNNYIGTVATKYLYTAAGDSYYIDKLEPSNGVEYFYPNKIQLTGNYNLRFIGFDGNDPVNFNPNNVDYIYLLIEYYQE